MAELNSILSTMKEIGKSGLEKTANDKGNPGAKTAAEEELNTALKDALNAATKTASEGTTKTASATDELTKIANDLAGADKEALTKEAHLFGASFADGCMERLAQYDASVVMGGEEKVASDISEEEFEKWAQENPEEFRRNFEAGLAEGQELVKQAQTEELEKLASTPEGQEKIAAFNEGYEKTAQDLEKLASTAEGQEKLASFGQGYGDAMQQLTSLASEEGGAEKIAALRSGYVEGTKLTEKLASDYHARGYNDTIGLLNEVVKG